LIKLELEFCFSPVNHRAHVGIQASVAHDWIARYPLQETSCGRTATRVKLSRSARSGRLFE